MRSHIARTLAEVSGAEDRPCTSEHVGDRVHDNLLHDRLALIANQARAANSTGFVSDPFTGVCEGCGERIAAERLEAVPNAQFCVVCQEESERPFRAQRGNCRR